MAHKALFREYTSSEPSYGDDDLITDFDYDFDGDVDDVFLF